MEEKGYEVSFDYVINSIYCKLLDSAYYLCVLEQNNKVYVVILEHLCQNNDAQILIKRYPELLINNIPPYKIILYDTHKDDYKILCTTNKEDFNVSCIILKYDTSKNNDLQFPSFTSYKTKFIINEDNCYLTKFYSEFLLCCGMTEKISCKRKNIIFETIDEFYVHLPGNIYNLTISNNINHSILLYMNETSEENYLYKYYIYPLHVKIFLK